MIHVQIVDSVQLVCESMAEVLANRDDIDVVGGALTIDVALAQMASTECDVALISTNLPDGGALTLTDTITREHPTVRVIIFGIANIEAIILRYIEAGALGHVLREESSDSMLEKVRAAAAEQALVPPEIAAALIERVATLAERLIDLDVDPADYDALTAREKEVLDPIADGLSNREIANFLTVEIGTVKNHVHNILDKLNVHTRHDAAIYLSLIEHAQATEDIVN